MDQPFKDSKNDKIESTISKYQSHVNLYNNKEGQDFNGSKDESDKYISFLLTTLHLFS